jgi:N-acyl-D-amino-acid deacylase
MLELLREEDFRVSVFAFGQHPYLVREALKQSFAMAVSDTVAELSGHPHPRAYGAFPTYFHDLSLDSSALTLGEAIRRVTHLPAEVYGLRKRGAIREGNFADIMIWDQKSYNAKSTYQNPRVPAEGVRYLFINGRLVIDDYKMTAKRPGRVLRRTGSQKKVDG